MKNYIINPNTQNLIKETIATESFVEAIALCESFIASKLKMLLRGQTNSDRYLDKDIISTCRAINRYSWDKRITPFVNEEVITWWNRRNILFHYQDDFLYTPKQRIEELKKLAIRGEMVVEHLVFILQNYKEPGYINVTI
ncbi:MULTISPECIES: hypothetical protein [Flavobacteriaceae]|uniref:Uncharacterized protein n=2 Tax=Flavobacteriaceae TaxID=49546 RepID=A0A4Y8AUT8_9FLAO|nr:MULTISPECIES: hypothetical protein [Flavobacteriaceae]TEW75126.1 hypothetical protein E2488_06280 [Gramella jeungdoensis]GGK41371.1 hypothetical protein GCM10007963_06740 [Lutibacter litoralis]